MNEQRAEQLIVVSLFVFLASEIGNYLVTKQQPTGHLTKEGKKGLGRRIVGGFLTMLFASLAAMAAPEVGALLAITVASYAFFHDGLPAINRGYKTPGETPLTKQEFEREKFQTGPLAEASPIALTTAAEVMAA